MTITYIHHSCFVIEDKPAKTALVFDYYKGENLILPLLADKEKVYIFSSHSHFDHFNPDIFKWQETYPNTAFKYILSFDIAAFISADEAGADITYLTPGQTYKDGVISVNAYGSTDCGVSFLCEFGGKKLFHAGDLNNWHWNEGATATESAAAESAFLSELDVISAAHPAIDFAMFLVDPRLGRDHAKGAEQFITAVKTGLFAPMHFHGEYGTAARFTDICAAKGVKFFRITKQGEQINI